MIRPALRALVLAVYVLAGCAAAILAGQAIALLERMVAR